jgi:signal transduction histidine kinase
LIDLGALYGDEGRRALLDPAEALPTWHRHAYDQAQALARYARACREEDSPATVGESLAKALAWQRAACQKGPALDDAFFAAPPFMHPSGRSFVALAASSRGPAWERDHARGLHALELGSAAEGDLRLPGSLSRGSLRALTRGDALVLDAQRLFVRAPQRGMIGEGGAFLTFPRVAWEEHVRGASVTLSARSPGALCAAPATPDLCWTVPPPSSWRAAAAASASTLAAALLGFAAIRRMARRRAAADRALVLRTLTHELRTPATSLALAIEPLRRAYDELPPAVQEPVLRVCDDVERIQRVIAVSGRWLSLQDPRRGAGLEIEWLAVEPFFRDLVDAYGGEVELAAPLDEGALSTDPRWLRIAVKNLVDNALAHGRPPVRVAVRWERGQLAIDVVDGGDSRGARLADLTAAFRKGSSSTGLGLGLAIVARVAELLGGALEHHAEPTKFTLRVADLEGGRT